MSDQVGLKLPASSAYLSVLRTATAALASGLDFTIDDIEDLRIAVDEACALLLPQAMEEAELDCRFTLGSGELGFTVTTSTKEPQPLSEDSFAWTVLSALAGDVKSTVEGDRVTVSLVKRRESPA